MKKWYQIHILILLSGTTFAWYTVVMDFIRFYEYEGTLLKIHDCVVPNPVVTPCFYGAWAFVIALVLSILVLHKPDHRSRFQKYLIWLLGAGTLFAAGNFTFTVVRYMQSRAAQETFTGCSGVAASHPLATPCFIGFLFFTTAFVTGLYIMRKYKNDHQATF